MSRTASTKTVVSKNASKTLPKKRVVVKKKTPDTTSIETLNHDKLAKLAPQKTIDNKLWEVSNAFIDQYGLVSMHVDSFNYAIEEMIPAIIAEKGKISLLRNEETHFIEFTNFMAKSPVYKNEAGKVVKLIPRVCMDKGLSYMAGLYCDIIYKGPNDQVNIYERKYMGDIPIPVYCNLCNLHAIKGDIDQLIALQEDINDKGGYYILKGSQKLIVPQVRPSHNNIHIFNGKATTSNGKSKFSKYTETKCGGLTSHITTVQVGISTKSHLIGVSIPYIEACSIPLGIVFAALGITNAKLISSFIFEKAIYDNPPTPKHKQAILILVKSLEQSWNILSVGEENIQEKALYYIGVRGKKFTEKVENQKKTKRDTLIDQQQTIEYAKHLLRVEFLPHIDNNRYYDASLQSEEESNNISTPPFFSMEKAVFLGYMTRKLLLSHVGLMPVSDRDHTANKRVHTSGMIMAAHFYKAFCQLTGKIISCIDNDIKKKKPINVASYITSPHIITTSFTNALMSNKWSSTGPPQGISQTIDTFNYVAYLSCVRKFLIPMANEGGKIEPPRHLHGSQWGCSCLTGDTLIMLADGTYSPISELKDCKRPIMTVNRDTLKNEPSGIYNFFELPSREIYLIEDEAGNTIKCTKDHKFLVYKNIMSNLYTETTKRTYKDIDYNSVTTEFVEAKDLTDEHVLIHHKISDGMSCGSGAIGVSGIDKMLMRTSKAFTRIKSITKLEGLYSVYDFTTISKNHTIIANNIVTSNCPYETPEGKRVGLVQVLAAGSFITVGCDHYPIIEFLRDMNIVPLSEIKESDNIISLDHLDNFLCNTRIFVNGIPQGYTFHPEEVITTLRNMRRKCNLNSCVSLSYDKEYKEISISTDAGRMIRGLCVLNAGKLAIPEHILDGIRLERERGIYGATENSKTQLNIETSVWMYLMEKGYVELIDKAEEENLNVAIYPSDLDNMSKSDRIQYTHCEMTPDMIEGIGANTSPKNDCNQAPRNIYQSAMAKQSIGVPGLNHRYYKKGKWHTLVYPQKPIVSTRIARKAGLDMVPMGQNATVLVMPWYGFNQEDSLVLNEDAINRGFMCSYAYVSYEATIENPNLPGTQKYQEFKIPQEKICNDYRGNFSKLIEDGKWCYVPKGTEVSKGDILIGMVLTSGSSHLNTTVHNKKKTNDTFETNISVIYDQRWPSTVHSVTCGKNGDGYMTIRVVTRQYRKPVRGDKFAARHGQKGTAGEILPAEKMPFLARLGYTPNILMNPLAYPSRMTIGLFVEAIMGIALTSSALTCPEYNKPLFLDKNDPHYKDRPECMTVDFGKDKLKYPSNFNVETDYAMSLDGDASPFVKSFDHNYILSCIEKLGVPGFSLEEVIIPETGERLHSLIFQGVMYYQRLKHMTVDKIHARATGSNHALHRQPTEGRKKKGGFRVGHMERDNGCVLSPIALKEGVSVMLGKMKRFESVWGWHAEKELLVKCRQINHYKPKHRTAYIITLQDGRTITASEQHPFYVRNEQNEREVIEMEENGEEIPEGFIRNDRYVEVRHLDIETDKLLCSVNPPLVDFEEDLLRLKNYAWNSDFFNEINPKFGKLSDYEVMRKSLALARLVGYAITDGHAVSKVNAISVFMGHTLDVETITDDIERISGIVPSSVEKGGIFVINLPIGLAKIIGAMGIIRGAKVSKEAIFPDFIHEMTPQPILREFLGGLFGGDGHTCCLSMHRGKMDLMKSVSISWTKDSNNITSLQAHMETLMWILRLRFDIESTIQAPKLTTNSKLKGGDHKQILLNIPLTHLIPFAEKIGFRYCEHKSIRLSAGVSYRRFRENVLRQRSWISERVDRLIDYRGKKLENPNCKINGLAEAVEKATEELKMIEPILHKESIPVSKRVGQLLTGKVNNEIRSASFPDVGEYMKDIGALKFFLDENDPESKEVTYGTKKDEHGIPAYYLKIVDVRKQDYTVEMCDITVDESTSSYVINGTVSHNCMLAQGVPEMVQDRLLYQSDVYKQPICQVCGLPAIDDGKVKYCRICQKSKIPTVQLPFGTKLLSQEFSVLNIVPRIITIPEK